LNFGFYIRSDDFFNLGLSQFYLEMGMFDEVLSLIGEKHTNGIRAHIMLGNTSYARELLNKRDLIEEPSYEWAGIIAGLENWTPHFTGLKGLLRTEV
jgi:hypothetical protein